MLTVTMLALVLAIVWGARRRAGPGREHAGRRACAARPVHAPVLVRKLGKGEGLAGGILSTSFQFGAALGLAAVTAVDAAAVVGVVVTAPGLRTRARTALPG